LKVVLGGVLLGAGSWGAVPRDFGGGWGVRVEEGVKGSFTGVVGGYEAFYQGGVSLAT